MKRIISLCLTLLLLMSLLTPAGRAAVEPMSISEAGVDLIKGFEGYRQYPYLYNEKWYIGYGIACGQYDYPNGITKEEADGMLRLELADDVNTVNNFLSNYDIQVNQAQFDALVSFTYNLGSQWIADPTSRIRNFLIDGIEQYAQDEIISAIGAWCGGGTGGISVGIVNRRLTEAYVFLTGDYSGTYKGQYTFLRYLAGEGSVEHRMYFYPTNQPYGALEIPVCEGKVFQGWYTSDGVEITSDTVATTHLEVTARWAEPSQIIEWDNPYTDLPDDHWSISYVRDLSLLGIIDGYEDGTFQPDRFLRAGEALKLIILAADHPAQPAVDEHWASGYLAYAIQQGWLAEGQITDLNASVTRGLIAQLAALAMDLPVSETVSPFADTSDPYVLSLYDAAIVEGDSTSGQTLYRPNDNIRRSHICAIIWRMERYEAPVKEEPKPTPEELGYITYTDKQVPLLRDVPACTRDPQLYTKDERNWITYHDSSVYTSAGIDISAYQGTNIDWEAVRADGIDFVMIRAGYRGYTQGTINADTSFPINYEGARAAGLKVGAYFFSTSTSPQEAQEEAAFVLDILDGRTLDLPLVYDWETGGSSYRNNKLDSATLTDCAITFCDAVEAAGYQSMIYFNLPIGYLRYNLSALTDYDFWLAQYHDQPTMYYDYQMWQYTDSGKVNGINGKVDMNILFKEY